MAADENWIINCAGAGDHMILQYNGLLLAELVVKPPHTSLSSVKEAISSSNTRSFLLATLNYDVY